METGPDPYTRLLAERDAAVERCRELLLRADMRIFRRMKRHEREEFDRLSDRIAHLDTMRPLALRGYRVTRD